MKFLLDDSDQHIGGYGTPYLGLDCVFAVADEALDAQMLLDPFEKQFHLPAALVELGDGQRGKQGIVGEEHQRLSGYWVLESHSAQLIGVVHCGFFDGQGDTLIADYACGPIDWLGTNAAGAGIGFGASDKVSSALMQGVETLEIQVTSIHDVERTGLERNHVHDIDIVNRAIGNMDERWDISAQIQQSMHFYSGLGSAKGGPRKQGQTQVYGRGVQGIDGILQVDREIVLAVKFARFANQKCGQICPNMPVASFVGVGQCRAPDRLTKTHTVEFSVIGQQTGFDVAQTLAVSKLSEGHGAKLFGTGQTSNSGIASIAIYDAAETGPRNELHDLSKKSLSRIHASSPERSISGSYLNLEVWNLNSNRHQTKSPRKACQYGVLSMNFLT